MKPVTPEVSALLETGVFACYNLYSLTLFGGGVIRFTNCQVDIAWDGDVWSSRGVRVDPKGSRAVGHQKIGLDVDTWVVTVMPRIRDEITGAAYPDKIGGVPWGAAAAAGALDNADFVVTRAYFPAAPTLPLPAGNAATPTGIITIFAGTVGEVDIGDTTVIINAMDDRSRLNIQLPRNYFKAACRHTLFDSGCQLTAATFKKTGLVGAGSTQSLIISTIAAPDGSGTYALGRIVMTSGLNQTFSRAVRSWQGGQLGLITPLPFAVMAGDTFDAYPGCDKSATTCTAFANLANYGGEPEIPDPSTAV